MQTYVLFILSENSEFSQKCKEENIIFIGPSATIIEIMGNKIAARNLMKQAGVPVIPGTEGTVKTIEEAKEAVKNIGYPLVLKASLGGGGVGLQNVNNEEELEKTFHNNAKRAESLFGDGSMFLEKLLENARHVEVQVLADEYGNAIHLFERECSIQRRNQKVMEEAPAYALSEKTRTLMGEVSVKAIKELGYTNVRTIEFLVDKDEQLFFRNEYKNTSRTSYNRRNY